MDSAIKKTFHHPKRNQQLRDEFISTISKIAKDRLVFLDESGIEDNSCSTHGWSNKGSRCYGAKQFQHKRRISMIGGLRNKKLIAPVIFDGNCDKNVFESYVEQILIKELEPGQIIVMDNINFHKSPKVLKAIADKGCSIMFLPTYSPDLNPIEHYWFKLKHHIRKTAHNFSDFFQAVCSGFQIVTSLSS